MSYPPSIAEPEINKIVTFIKSTFKSQGFQKAIIGVSGGIDSATSLLLSTQALGSANIHAYMLPGKTTNEIHLKHAREIIDVAQIPAENIHTLPIKAIIQKSWRIIKHYHISSILQSTQVSSRTGSRPAVGGMGVHAERTVYSKNDAHINQLRLANLSARIRMMLLFDAAKKHNALVIGTENRSEHLLGYYTRFGDAASDLEPIVHLYKTQVQQLAKNLNIPEAIITKAPSADLWANQTDEQEMGFSYKEADPILYLHYDQNLSETEIIKKLKINKTLVQKVLSVCRQNSFKLRVPYLIKPTLKSSN